MEVAEHFYSDDPTQGPPDAKTTLAGVDYFFLGNGLIQAAVQVCTSGLATPLGLLILHPERLGPKRTALTFDLKHGLAPTTVRIRTATGLLAPQPGSLDAHWTDVGGVPACGSHGKATTCRSKRPSIAPLVSPGVWSAAYGHASHLRAFSVGPFAQARSKSHWTVRSSCQNVSRRKRRLSTRRVGAAMTGKCMPHWTAAPTDEADGASLWAGCATLSCPSPTLEHLFRAARNQLPAVITASGRMDGSIWQYNLEWVRDQACAATALVCLGAVELARTMIDRLLTEFVSDEGDCVDSGRRRAAADVELDQNGYLITALETYVNWTGDVDLLRRHWARVVALAEFPLRGEFRHAPSGLLHNRREYWERHDVHGIQDGLEMVHQLYVAVAWRAQRVWRG